MITLQCENCGSLAGCRRLFAKELNVSDDAAGKTGGSEMTKKKEMKVADLLFELRELGVDTGKLDGPSEIAVGAPVLVQQRTREGFRLPRMTGGRVEAVQGQVLGVSTPYGPVWVRASDVTLVGGSMAQFVDGALEKIEETA